MPTHPLPACTAFVRHQRVAAGSYADVATTLAELDQPTGSFLVFDDATGNQVDFPWPAGYAPEPPAQVDVTDEPPAPPSVGRPKLGVVAREVTLLPRHWEWLGQQRGGASAALRRLVDEARAAHASRDRIRQAKEAGYRFMSAIGGDLPGFEDASRALFAFDAADFSRKIAHWPVDVQAYLAWLSRDAFPV
ncbi:DUF2239 family protein [Pseudomonas extremorientalis]|uniref:DUF2239 domain-containing protein n=1 Tax=Pseudomonas extremorientalis TaxID=169669 RepID=A0A1H0WLR0_9PSED|nr:DUF2239 family protein [Pseudomonas extremorientalis]KAB0514751.1 DUF2239 family protein [Pseudomonas extremorientalis]OIN06046.1 hypothetical protein BFN10_20950 [Pseudomonas extremorientalis]WLG59188.1 DUF2239 family protein [Pseudomonas extremorientalis]SDP91630.1 hypothetical protein SAMN04490184_5869 [Pseudomonas extremorientalis]